ncbi:MAG: hypothetical protein ABI846_07685 [Rudaea sp.]
MLRLSACCVFVLGFLASAVAVAQDSGNVASLANFLDKSTPAQNRLAIFDVWTKTALAGDADAQYLVGTIYRRGDAIEPHVAERDATQARRYLSTAAAHGRLLAMAKMAELELTEDHPLEAMIWAQAYGAYRGWVGSGAREYGDHNDHQPTLYFEDLLRRVSKRLVQRFGEEKTQEVLAGLNQFVAAHDGDVRAGMAREGLSPQWAHGQARFENAKDFRRVGVFLHDTISEWVLGFSADGSVASAEVLDAIPEFKNANGHHGIVMQYRTGASRRDAPERYALKTIDLKKADWPLGPTVTR